jgi:hypothetical protein
LCCLLLQPIRFDSGKRLLLYNVIDFFGKLKKELAIAQLRRLLTLGTHQRFKTGKLYSDKLAQLLHTFF